MIRLLIFFILFYYKIFFILAQLSTFRPQIFHLENGLTVILNPNHLSTNVFGAIVVKAGSKHDPSDATGLAHYQEHMLFKGTQELGTIDWEKEKVHIDRIFKLYDELAKEKDPDKKAQIQQEINKESILANRYAIPNELDKLLKNIGSSNINAFTTPDMTVYFNEFPPSQIERWLEIYSHRFIQPVFRGFQAELEVVYEEFNMYYDFFFTNILDELQKQLFKKHPYGQHPAIGKQEHLKQPSLVRMYEFFQNWYVPNNMALILSGNFDPEYVKPIIFDKFSKWKFKTLSEIKTADESPFQGRELIEVKMSPIPLVILGFRAPSLSHKDHYKLIILSNLLTNSLQTGILDKLVLDAKLLAVQAISLPYVDHGALLILIVPKIVGQTLENAENLVRKTIDDFLSTDSFPIELFEAIKNELIINYKLIFESDLQICLKLAESFVTGKTIDDIYYYPEKLMKLTLSEMKQFADSILGPNYLALYSRIGFPKKPKIEKPSYEPLTNHPKDAKSNYYKQVMNMPLKAELSPLYPYEKLVSIHHVGDNLKLYFTQNPLNDIFTLTIRFYLIDKTSKLLPFATQLFNMASTSTQSLEAIKKNFSILGIKYDFSYHDYYIQLELKGLEHNLYDGLILLKSILSDPHIDEKHIKTAIQAEKANRKIEISDAENVSNVLNEYIMHGSNSYYMHRLSLKNMKKLTSNEITQEFLKVLNNHVVFFYVGQENYLEKIIPLLNEMFDKNQPEITYFYSIPYLTYDQQQIAFLHKKNSIQSKIYFYGQSGIYDPYDEPLVDLFNAYFGGGFSGLVLREIREFRSMAYSADAAFYYPLNPKYPYIFKGYVGTQSDKTIDAVDVFINLIKNMPINESDLINLREYLQLSIYNKLPLFRDIPIKVFTDRIKQFHENPLIYKYNTYPTINELEVYKFYQKHLQNQPLVISIVADKKRFKLNQLKKYGNVKIYKLKNIYVK